MKIDRWLSAMIALVLLGTAACDDGLSTSADGTAATGPAAQPSDPAPPRCADQETTVAQGERVGGEVNGDVDGDGADDVVYLVLDGAGGPGCRTFLVIETGTGTVSAPTNDEGIEYSLQAPRVHSLVDIDGEPGAEILVDLEQGAATQFLGMFTYRGGSIQRVRITGDPVYSDLFPYGGSVGHIEASNCAAPGTVVIAVANPVAEGYRIERTVYQAEGATLVSGDRQPDERGVIVPAGEVDALNDFKTSPFGDCEGGQE